MRRPHMQLLLCTMPIPIVRSASPFLTRKQSEYRNVTMLIIDGSFSLAGVSSNSYRVIKYNLCEIAPSTVRLCATRFLLVLSRKRTCWCTRLNVRSRVCMLSYTFPRPSLSFRTLNLTISIVGTPHRKKKTERKKNEALRKIHS